MTYFYAFATIALIIAAWSIASSLDRVAKAIGVVATCNIFWMVYHGNDAAIAEAGAHIAAKVGEIATDDVAVPEATTKEAQ